MFDHRHYVPVLKGKQGEYFSLRDLDPAIKASLTPLIEIPPIDWDFDEGRPKKSIDDQVANVPQKIRDAWAEPERPLFVDLGLLAEEGRLEDGRHPIDFVFGGLRGEDVPAVPVTGLDRPAEFQEAVTRAVREDGNGVCLRLVDDNFEDVLELERRLNELLGNSSLQAQDADVLIDLRELPVGQANTMALAVRGILNALPHISEWRSLTVAGTAFPENLSGFERASASATERTEWLLWRTLIAGGKLPRNPTFGDYAIAHPEIAQIDPRFMRMSAQLRYTVDEDWLIFKERNVRDHGFDQFNDICCELVGRPEYSGPDFSWGDAYISDCAQNKDGPGNATTWRRVANTHHMAFVVSQIASLP